MTLIEGALDKATDRLDKRSAQMNEKIDMMLDLQRARLELEQARLDFEREKAGLPVKKKIEKNKLVCVSNFSNTLIYVLT